MYGHPELTREHAESMAPEAEDLTDIFGGQVSVYTREQALDDGMLVDVTDTAAEAGFRLPVALTRAAWSDCVEWTEADSKRQAYQDESGRLWDVLWMASIAARRNRGGDRARFQLYRVPRGGRGVKPRLVTLEMHIGGGDQGEPVITIMMPEED